MTWKPKILLTILVLLVLLQFSLLLIPLPTPPTHCVKCRNFHTKKLGDITVFYAVTTTTALSTTTTTIAQLLFLLLQLLVRIIETKAKNYVKIYFIFVTYLARKRLSNAMCFNIFCFWLNLTFYPHYNVFLRHLHF